MKYSSYFDFNEAEKDWDDKTKANIKSGVGEDSSKFSKATLRD